MDLSNIDLFALQTKMMQQDNTTAAMSVAIKNQLVNLADTVNLIMIYARIDEMFEDVLDSLAWQFNCSWYDATASLGNKRKIIKTALLVHKTRGTRFAVEEVVKSYFNDAEVKEWFEYAGDPYTFKVIVRNGAAPGQLDRLTKAINAVKNARSQMDEIVYGLICSDTLMCSDSLIII